MAFVGRSPPDLGQGGQDRGLICGAAGLVLALRDYRAYHGLEPAIELQCVRLTVGEKGRLLDLPVFTCGVGCLSGRLDSVGGGLLRGQAGRVPCSVACRAASALSVEASSAASRYEVCM